MNLKSAVVASSTLATWVPRLATQVWTSATRSRVRIWSAFRKAVVCAVLGTLLLARCVWAQGGPAQPVTARSHSGQFLVQGLAQPGLLSEPLRRTEATNWARLDPPLVVMSCERIKDALLELLDSRDHWQGKIFIQIHPIRRLTDGIQVTQTHFADGWTYHVDMPDAVEPAKFVRALVGVLVVERANRNHAGQSADVPAWLIEGLAQELLTDQARELVVRAPDMLIDRLYQRKTTRSGRRVPTLAAAQAFFADGRAPLTFDELSWPAPDAFTDENAPRFGYSAQLFAHDLLLLRNGGPSLGAMLDRLGRCRNWQTAFLQAFSGHFSRLLDVDKWWELQRLGFQERGISPTWDVLDSLSKLDEALPIPIQRQVGTNSPAPREALSLQAFLQQADDARQLELLPAKIRQLQSLPLRVDPEVSPLVGKYLTTLETYHHQLDRNMHAPPARRMNRFLFSKVLRNTVQQLNALDAARAQLARTSVPLQPGAPTGRHPILRNVPVK